MQILDTIKSFFNKPSTREIILQVRNTYAAGRVTVDHPYRKYRGGQVLKGTDFLNQNWQMRFLEEENIAYMSTIELLNLLKDVSPDFNRALNDFRRFVLTDYSIIVEDNPAGQAILDEALETMRRNKDPFGVKLEKAVSSVFLHGAIFSELVLDLSGVNFENIRIIDAMWAAFKPEDDPVEGQIYRLGQQKDGRFVDLHEDDTVDYVAFNTVAGSPFGHSMAAAAIFPIVFSLQVLKDLRQVVRTQAYPFVYATVSREELVKGNITDADAQEAILNQTRDDLVKFLSTPAGPYTKSPIIGREADIQRLESSGGGLRGIETVMRIVEGMIIRALQTSPIFFGVNIASGIGDNSNTQAELHYITIDSIQRTIEDWVTGILTEILRARGNPGEVTFELKRINTFVNKSRLETIKLKVDIIERAIQNGIISRQEARMLLRHPDPFNDIESLLEEQLPPDAQVTAQAPNPESESEPDLT